MGLPSGYWPSSICFQNCGSIACVCMIIVVLTCYAGHTSHNGGLLIRDTRCRTSTDHRPPLAPLTAAEKHTVRIKYCRQIFNVKMFASRNENHKIFKRNTPARQTEEVKCKRNSMWQRIQELQYLGMSWEEFDQCAYFMCVWFREKGRETEESINA